MDHAKDSRFNPRLKENKFLLEIRKYWKIHIKNYYSH